eukprot:COSAG03_NODE_716_length_6124_cov_162.473693_4_plen_106_part_00
MVLVAGGPVDITAARDNPKVQVCVCVCVCVTRALSLPCAFHSKCHRRLRLFVRLQSILWVGYPGQSGGTAVAETLFGLNNPGGRYAALHTHARARTAFVCLDTIS